VGTLSSIVSNCTEFHTVRTLESDETSKNLSQHMHDNAFDSVWFGENYECILGVSPTDSMHEFLHTLVSFQQWTNRSSLLQFEVLSL